jgi:hypothetical protein
MREGMSLGSEFDFEALVDAVAAVHTSMATRAARAVNVSLTLRNWLIGAYIAEYELRGADRATYGEQLLETLADRLFASGIRRVDARELRRCKQFYVAYPGLLRGRVGADADLPGGGWSAADERAAEALGLDRDTVERRAMEGVMAAERVLGREPRDVSHLRGLGHDVESRDTGTGDSYFLEVKGRAVGSDQLTLTRTEMLCALNKPAHFATYPLASLLRQAGAPC